MIILRHIPTSTLLSAYGIPCEPFKVINDAMNPNITLCNSTMIYGPGTPVAVALAVPHHSNCYAGKVRERVKALGATFNYEILCYIINCQRWNNMSVDDRQELFRDGLVSGLIVNEYIPWKFSARYPKSEVPTLILKTSGSYADMYPLFKQLGCKWIPNQKAWSWTPTKADVLSGTMISTIELLNSLMVIHYEVGVNYKTNEMLANDYLDDTGKVACVGTLQQNYDFLIAHAIRSSFTQDKIMDTTGRTVYVMVTRTLPELKDSGIGHSGLDNDALLVYGSKVATGDIGLKVHVFVPCHEDIMTIHAIELCGNPNISTYGATLPELRRKMLHLIPEHSVASWIGATARFTTRIGLSEFALASKSLTTPLILDVARSRESWEQLARVDTLLETRSMVMDPNWIAAIIGNGHFIPNTGSVANANYAMTA